MQHSECQPNCRLAFIGEQIRRAALTQVVRRDGGPPIFIKFIRHQERVVVAMVVVVVGLNDVVVVVLVLDDVAGRAAVRGARLVDVLNGSLLG